MLGDPSLLVENLPAFKHTVLAIFEALSNYNYFGMNPTY